MNRFAACGVVLGLGALAMAQDLTKKISVEIPASRATVALAALGKAAGISMEPAGNLRDEVFVICAHDATVDEIMKRVAQAESGAWSLQNGAYFLTRDHSTSIMQERAETNARAKALSAEIAKLTGAVAKQSKFDQTAAQKLADETKRTIDQVSQGGGGVRTKIDLNGADQKTPAARAIARLLSIMDPVKLAQIGPDQRIVFSTQPTPMQQPVGNGSFRAFEQFVEEQMMYTQAYGADQPQDGNRRVFVMNGFGTPTMGNGDPKLGLGVGLVIVQRRFGGMLDVQILATDTKLDTLASGSYTLQLPRPGPLPGAQSNEEPLKISDEAKEMAKALSTGGGAGGGPGPGMVRAFAVSSSGGGGGFSYSMVSSGNGAGNIKLSPALRAKVLDPVTYDPMSFAPGEAMTALSHQSGKNLVALLPDTCFGSMNRQFAGSVTASQLMASLDPMHSLAATQDESWIVVSPEAPATGRANTVSRSVLKGLLAKMDKSGFLRLDEVADFALAESKTPGLEDIDIQYPRLINNASADRDLMPLAMGSDSLYKFYGTLSSSQREAVAASRQISFMNLSGQQIALIADMLYNSQQGPNVQQDNSGIQPPGAVSFTVTGQAGGQMPMFFAGGLSAKTERTIVMPNGVLNNGFMHGSVNTQQVVQGISSQTGATQILDANTLAFSKSAGSRPELASFSTPQYDKYRMAHQTNLSIQFEFNPRVSMARSLSDASPDADALALPYDSLPADFRQRVEQMAQQMQRGFQQLPARNQGTPPPAR
ncbi:MAG: hypothetical protein ACHQ50_01545 [Fimbriimonadales bacterium]